MAVRRQARLDAAVARYWTKVEKTDTCWLWTGGVHKGTGYGQGGLLGETIAHRAAYRLAFGSIPDGLVIDHLCRVKTCVNPAHLEAVPQRENVRRGIAVELRHLRPRAPKTHCLNGHARTVDQISSNGACRVCQREREPSREPRTHKRRVAA